MLSVRPFLTAYDPSDLPGGSIDPLGFDRGYLVLADKILPGLTNVASRPRYFSVFCAAILLSDEGASGTDGATPRARRERRSEAVLRFERFWVLASVLAARSDDDLDNSGIRGIRYVEREVARLEGGGETSTTADYRLLSRQIPYGMLGIYGTVADTLKLLARDTLSLGPDLGRRLGEAFLAETRVSGPLRRAVVEGGSVGLHNLGSWGQAAHVGAPTGPLEARALSEAFQCNDTRRRMGELLRDHPAVEGETELGRLRRIHEVLASGADHPDLREGLRAIVAFEECYRLLLLVFSRLLWFCQAEEPFAVELDKAGHDPVLGEVREQVRDAWHRLNSALLEGRTRPFVENLSRLDDVRQFVENCAQCTTVEALVEQVLLRHRAVQRAKVQGGRPKMPWIELVGGKVAPTLTAAQQVRRAPDKPGDMGAHPYRTGAADQFIAAGRIA